MKITLHCGDITALHVDAVVNAANEALAGGGGVDGAIHRAAGPTLATECDIIRQKQGRCPTGQAVITSAGNMPAKYVIHTVGTVWHGGKRKEPALLANCYRNSLLIAEENKIETIAFPSISTGVYGYPIEKAVKIAFDVVTKHRARYLTDVCFVLFSEHDFQIYLNEKKRQRA